MKVVFTRVIAAPPLLGKMRKLSCAGVKLQIRPASYLRAMRIDPTTR